MSGRQIISHVGGDVDLIIGGPPCQGFSSIGRGRLDDPRRELMKEFFRIVLETEPAFFLMENVVGLISGKNIGELHKHLGSVEGLYDLEGPTVLDASDFGAATRRKRVFVLGCRKDCHLSGAVLKDKEIERSSVADAIRDLSSLDPDGEEDGFDRWTYRNDLNISHYAKRLRCGGTETTGHRKTPHKAEVTARFEKLPQGATDPVGRYPRLSWDGLCPTLRAGTGPDKGSYQAVRPIHPTEPRVITVREAARLQGFPDWFRFHPTVWHSFRMIGNSVSPVLAEALLRQLRNAAA